MKVRLTRPTLNGLERIYDYISKDNPVAASRVIARLIERAMSLADAPYQGRETDEPNTRMVVVPRFRYFIFYAIEGDEVHITHFGILRAGGHGICHSGRCRGPLEIARICAASIGDQLSPAILTAAKWSRRICGSSVGGVRPKPQ